MEQTSVVYQTEFKTQAIKMLKKLRKVIDKNVAHCDNELKTIKMSQSNNSVAEIKTNLKAMNSTT